MRKNNLLKKMLVFGIIVLFIGAVVTPSISGNFKKINTEGNYLKRNQSNVPGVWYEDFYDGDISDWTIENPTSGDNPITLELSTEHAFSKPFSLKISGPNEDWYGAKACGPKLKINTEQPYTIWFMFRYVNAHFYTLIAFENVHLIIDTLENPIAYYNETGWHYLEESLPFLIISLPNIWNHWRIEVLPDITSYVIIVNELIIGIVNYSSFNTGIHSFYICDKGGDAPAEPDFIQDAYYDNIYVTYTKKTFRETECDHNNLEANIPWDKLAVNSLFMRLLERFPNLFKLMQMLFQRLGLQ
jgi:hypothetical protein